jgi:hypothetical protein
MRGAPWKSLAAWVSTERGAPLWLPGLLLAVAVTLFAMRVAPVGVSLFTRTTSLRIALGPCAAQGASAAESAAFVGALRRALAAGGDVSLVDSVRVARRLAAQAASAAVGADSLLHAVRPLNPHLALRLELRRSSDLLRARVEAWDVHDGRRTCAVEAASYVPQVLGRVMAESLVVALHRPGPAVAATQPRALELRSSSTDR